MNENNGFIVALNSLHKGKPGILIDQLYDLYCKINHLDPDGTFAAFETIITARELYELKNQLTDEEDLFFQGMVRALQLQMVSHHKRNPEDMAIDKKLNIMYDKRFGFTCRK